MEENKERLCSQDEISKTVQSRAFLGAVLRRLETQYANKYKDQFVGTIFSRDLQTILDVMYGKRIKKLSSMQLRSSIETLRGILGILSVLADLTENDRIYDIEGSLDIIFNQLYKAKKEAEDDWR